MVAQVKEVKAVEKPKESLADMLYRLYRKGLEEGVTILTEGDSEKKFATSGTMPSIIYAVSELGCSCQGFRSFGRCKHYAMLLEHVGKRPPAESEFADIRAEWIRERSLFTRNLVKSTADWRHFQTVKRTYERAVELAGVRECMGCGGVGTIDQKDREGNRWTVTCRDCHGLPAVSLPPVALAAD